MRQFAIEDTMAYIVNMASLKMRNELTRRFRTFDITPEQWFVLNRLWEQDGISQKELSERTVKDQASTTRILDKLSEKGLIERRPNPEDRRGYMVYVTEKGRTVRDELITTVEQMHTELTDGISAADMATTRATLQTIIANVCRINPDIIGCDCLTDFE